MCELQKEAMSRNDEMPERRVTDRRETGAQFAADSHLRTVQAQQAIIASQQGEITALTAEVKHFASKVASAQAVPVASVGDDPAFRARLADLYSAYDESIELGISNPNDRAVSKLVAYIDSRATPASAPSGDRNSVLDEVANEVERFDKRATPKGIAVAIRCMKSAPQPVAAAQAVPDHNEAVLLLSAVFDAWENGEDCFEDGDPENSYMGKCFQLDDDVFKRCCDLLNRENPPRNASAISQETARAWRLQLENLLANPMPMPMMPAAEFERTATAHLDAIDKARAVLTTSPSPAAPKDAQGAVPDSLATIAAVQRYLVDVVRAFGDVSCAAYISTWHKPEQIAAQIAQPTDTTKGA